MPRLPAAPPGPIAGQPGHFAWTDWADDALVSLSRTPATASGQQRIVPVANTPTSVAITFPPGRFTVAPYVVAGLLTSVPGTTVKGCAVTSVTPTGCLLWVTRTNGTATYVHWIATEIGL